MNKDLGSYPKDIGGISKDIGGVFKDIGSQPRDLGSIPKDLIEKLPEDSLKKLMALVRYKKYLDELKKRNIRTNQIY